MGFIIGAFFAVLAVSAVGIATAKDKKEQAKATAGALATIAAGLLKAGAFLAGCFAGLLSHGKKYK